MGMMSGGSLVSMLGTLGNYARAALPVVRSISTIKDVIDDSDGDNRRAALRAQHDLAIRQLQAQQGILATNAAEQAALNREKISFESINAENSRRAALRRAVARQKAAFGAQGVSGNDGSGEAVLLGLFDESEEARAERENLDNMRFRAIDQDLGGQQRINVLQRTQLREKQNLERILAGF